MAGENDAAAGGTAARPACPAVPALAPPGGHYSHAAVGAGLVFVSGQLPVTPAGERLTRAPFEAQAVQVLANVRVALEAAGSDIGGLLQVRIYLADIADWPAFDAIYRRWAGDHRPARAVVPTGPLHFGFRVEVEATALVR